MIRFFHWICVISLGMALCGPSPLAFGADTPGINLIVRADDIASSHAANLACIKTCTEGIVRSVEILVPCAWFPEAVRMLNENPGIDVGVHLCLTSEWDAIKWRPVASVPSLTDANGYFFPVLWPGANRPALKEAPWKIEDVEKEFRAQIELAKKNITNVTHLSYHMGSNGWDPAVQKLCVDLAKEYQLDIHLQDHNVKSMGGFGQAKTLADREAAFIRQLKELKPGNYIFIEHPAFDTPEMETVGHPGYWDVGKDRQMVTDVFTSPAVKQAIQELGIHFISYADLRK